MVDKKNQSVIIQCDYLYKETDMKSNVIRITKDKDNLESVINEVNAFSDYIKLDKKRALRLRLIAEELLGMLRELAEEFEGDFWIENIDSFFTFFTELKTYDDMNMRIKKDLIAVSSNKKNSAAVGVMGKIRDAVENLLYPEDSYYNSAYIAYHLQTAALREDGWSLNKYKKSHKDDSEPWDELEKSIIANIADEVQVSVKGKKVAIVIFKDFEKENKK